MIHFAIHGKRIGFPGDVTGASDWHPRYPRYLCGNGLDDARLDELCSLALWRARVNLEQALITGRAELLELAREWWWLAIDCEADRCPSS